MDKRENARSRILATAVCFVAVIFLVRLFQVQIVRGADFDRLSHDQVTANSQYGYFERGDIYFQSAAGEIITAAGIKSGYILAIKPSLIVDPEGAYQELLAHLGGMEKEIFIAKASKSDDPYEEIAHRLTTEEYQILADKELPYISLVPEQWRYYPGGFLGSNVLGFVGYRDDVLTGQYGIEREYDNTLKRDTGNLYKNFFSDLFSGVKDEVFDQNEDSSFVHEGSVVLTIEPKVQSMIEEKSDELMTKWNAQKMGIIVIEPGSGRVIGASSRPTFDPNNYQIEEDQQVYQNPFIEDVFEMGSIMKPITVAAGLDAGVITANSTYNDKGYLEMDGKRIENYDGKGRGVVNMQEVLNHSLNTGATYVALKLGAARFREYITRFGLADRTDVDMPGEANNLISNLESDRDIEMATASYGQGIAVTPISMIRALGALANNGYLIKPHFVESVDLDMGITNNTKITEQGRAISTATSEEITRMLVKVVDEYLANGAIKLEHYSIAAKTGTAQIANPGGGGYYADRYMHSFFGYFPAYKPRFLVFMYLYEPEGATYASETLSMPFKDITQFLISYYNIAPDR